MNSELSDENTALISFKISPELKDLYFKACKKLDCNASQDLRKHVLEVTESFQEKLKIDER